MRVRDLRDRLVQDLDVVRRGVRVGIARAQPKRQRLARCCHTRRSAGDAHRCPCTCRPRPVCPSARSGSWRPSGSPPSSPDRGRPPGRPGSARAGPRSAATHGGGCAPGRWRSGPAARSQSPPGPATALASEATGPYSSALSRNPARSDSTRPPSAIHTAASASTRPRSWTGANPRRRSARDSAPVSPVRSASSRSTADPACDTTPCPPTSTVRSFDHALSCT